MPAILGKKVGMTSVYDDQGRQAPVTVIEAGPCRVLQVKTVETDGYNAVQLGFDEQKPQRLTKPLLGHIKKYNGVPVKRIREIRDFSLDVKPGDKIGVEIFEPGDFVDVTGYTKGRGFQGVVKRWGFGGGVASHGTKGWHRRPGAIGNRLTPGWVEKGKRMPESPIRKLVPYADKAKERGVKVRLINELNDDTCMMDSDQIKQVLLNIAINGIEACSDGGSLTISIRQAEEPSFIQIELADTGKGIPKETRERIFDPFFTTKEVGSGTGLGLSIVYGIIEKHHGTVAVESKVGEGTRFIIRVPCFTEIAEGRESSDAASANYDR